MCCLPSLRTLVILIIATGGGVIILAIVSFGPSGFVKAVRCETRACLTAQAREAFFVELRAIRTSIARDLTTRTREQPEPVAHGTISASGPPLGVLNNVRPEGTEASEYAETARLDGVLQNAGYTVRWGRVARLDHTADCEACFGSPYGPLAHLAVGFPTEGISDHGCGCYDGGWSCCFELAPHQAVVVQTRVPPPTVAGAWSWAGYVYDMFDLSSSSSSSSSANRSTERYIVQAATSRPLRPRHGGDLMLVFARTEDLAADILDVMRAGGAAGVENGRVLIAPGTVQELGNARFSLLRKSQAPVDVSLYPAMLSYLNDEWSNTRAFRVSVRQDAHKLIDLCGALVPPLAPSIRSRLRNQPPKASPDQDPEIAHIEQRLLEDSEGTPVPSRLVDVRTVTSITDVGDCVRRLLDCRGEDWDLSFTASKRLALPAEHTGIAVVGYMHRGAQSVELIVVDSLSNRVLATAHPRPYSSRDHYIHWFARACPEPYQQAGICTQIELLYSHPTEITLRERVYGLDRYIGLTPPYLVLRPTTWCDLVTHESLGVCTASNRFSVGPINLMTRWNPRFFFMALARVG